jgi:hypothetical protein
MDIREIKFKAYHKELKKMYDVFSFCDEFIKVKSDDDILKLPRSEFEPLMQYIGKLDKNGREIYEGYVVITDEAGWRAKVEYVDDGFICTDDAGGYSTSSNWYNYEVIGDIYNLDLIKK